MKRLKQLSQNWLVAVLSASSVSGLIIALRIWGFFQSAELDAYDLFLRFRPKETQDERIVIVALNETDIRKFQTSIVSDRLLSDLLKKVQAQNPRVIALDIYRDIPQPPGNTELVFFFLNSPNLIGIEKVVGDENSTIKPSPILKGLNRTAASDLVLDSDSVVRRNLLYPSIPSIGTAAALLYLKEEGFESKNAPDGSLQIGEEIFPDLPQNAGGYVNYDESGYQILLNYRNFSSSTGSFTTVSFSEVLENKINPDLFQDRIVFVGVSAISLKDTFLTPNSFLHTPPQPTPGVEIHAHSTSQIISRVLDGRPLIKIWSDLGEDFWVVFWVFLSAICLWRQKSCSSYLLFSVRFIGITGFLIVVVIGSSYLLFLNNWWIPIVPTLNGMVFTSLIVSGSISILKNQESKKICEYQVGGCLQPNALCYVVRQADRDLYQWLVSGEFCYVLNARQMGKSSLRVQMMNRLETEGFVCCAIDLTQSLSEEDTEERWYVSVIYQITEALNLTNRFDLIEWWESMRLLPPVHRFSEFIKKVILTEIPGKKIVIFIDEIDSILNLKFNTDNFFATIRYFYNERANYPELNRITFVLLGVASPSRLIKDHNRTPFNIGQAINLSGFSLDEAKPLTQGLKNKCNNPELVMKEILAWTGGQPLLTQRICQLIIDSDNFISQGQEAKLVENIVQTEIIDKWKYQDSYEHFKSIRARLLDTYLSSVELLKMYQRLLKVGEIMIDDSEEVTELLLSGLVRNCEGKLKVYNRIYRSIFDESWIAQTNEKNTL